MKVQEDTTGADLAATHLECIEGCGTFSLVDEGYDIETTPVDSTDDITCPNEDEGEDHPIELVHVSAEPCFSPDAKKTDASDEPWAGLSEFDKNRWDFGREHFVYSLEG